MYVRSSFVMPVKPTNDAALEICKLGTEYPDFVLKFARAGLVNITPRVGQVHIYYAIARLTRTAGNSA